MRPPSSRTCGTPRTFVMPSGRPGQQLGREVARACRPRAARISSICRNRWPSQASISAAAGSRLPGGRHLSTFAMKHCPARQADLREQLVEQLAGLARRTACPACPRGSPGASPDEHQVGVGVAGAEHDRVARPRPAGTSGSPRARGRTRRAPRRRRPRQWQPQATPHSLEAAVAASTGELVDRHGPEDARGAYGWKSTASGRSFRTCGRAYHADCLVLRRPSPTGMDRRDQARGRHQTTVWYLR